MRLGLPNLVESKSREESLNPPERIRHPASRFIGVNLHASDVKNPIFKVAPTADLRSDPGVMACCARIR